MPFSKCLRRLSAASLCFLLGYAASVAAAPAVIAPPESFFSIVRERDRDAARGFYRKYIDVNGLPVVAAGVVADEALQRTHEIVTHLLAGRPDLNQAMVRNGMYLIIIGRDQVYTDMPEYRNHPNPAYQNERVRGTGGKPTSFGEENLLSLPLDRYDDESIGVHEFCHTIDGALRSVDPDWSDRLNRVFRSARAAGLHQHTYAGSNAGEYWAEICQAYFDCNRMNNWNHGPVGRREQLKDYDPEGYELVRSTFRLGPGQDWRYSFRQSLPNVTAPPARFGLDPFYTRFTWAREFPVIGRGAPDAALLRANEIIRRMFAYRHDLLKALIGDGVKLVVLGRDEKVADLPGIARHPAVPGFDPLARTLAYHPSVKLVAVGEENILGDSRLPGVGDQQVIRLMAHAVHQVAATRPVDPNWTNRPSGEWQQYELRVERVDVRFDQRLAELHGQAVAAGKWRNTPAYRDRVAYWVDGVVAYFDAAGQHAAPVGAVQPVSTREALREYDPGLHALVHETMAYGGKVDWRFRP